MNRSDTSKPSPAAPRADTRRRHLGLITGLADERAILAAAVGQAADPTASSHDWPRLICAGADAKRARQQTEDLIGAGAEALVSFGVAGGLDPALRPGSLLLPTAVRLADGRDMAVDPAWHGALLESFRRQGLNSASGTLLGSEAALTTADAKARLFAQSGAVAVDMESTAVASVAAANGVPFLALRAVADPAERSLPSLVSGAVTPDGRSRPGLIARRLCAQPWRLPALLQLRRDYGLALDALRRAVKVGGDALFGGG